MSDSHRRSLAKGIIYRGVGITLLASVTWIFTRDLINMSLITITYQVIAIVGYYIHERLWEKVKWGRSQ